MRLQRQEPKAGQSGGRYSRVKCSSLSVGASDRVPGRWDIWEPVGFSKGAPGCCSASSSCSLFLHNVHYFPERYHLLGRQERKVLAVWGWQLQTWASLVPQAVKNPPAMRATWVPSLGREDALEKGTGQNIIYIYA